MWNLRSSIGLKGGQPAKQSFHTLPLVAGLTALPILSDKKFTNPNYVNKNNPSVLGYQTNVIETTIDTFNHPVIDTPNGSCKINVEKPHTTNNGQTDKPQENCSTFIESEDIKLQNSTPVEVSEEKLIKLQEFLEESEASAASPAKMCNVNKKKTRRSKRMRRRQRDSAKIPGKHCKNLDKEQKHSKEVENEYIIKESMMPVEMDESNQSLVSVEENGLPKCSSLLKLGDFIENLTKKSQQTDLARQEIRNEGCSDESVKVYSDFDEVDKGGWFTISFSPRKPAFRKRQVSVTESEDSFIVFGGDADNDEDFSDISDDETDEMNFEIVDEESDSDFTSSSSVIPLKKVRFADDSVLCNVHPMVKWSFAYQAARRGPWEEYARDRERFKMRIEEIEPTISQVLGLDHRNRIYGERFYKPLDVPMDI